MVEEDGTSTSRAYSDDHARAFESVSDAVVLLDEDGRITFMNEEAANITGTDADKAAGRNIWDVCMLIDQDSREPISTKLEGLQQHNGTFVFPVSTSIVSSDGIEKLVRGALHLSDSGKGGIVIRSIVFRDVSARWQIDVASQRVQKSQALRMLVEGVVRNLDDLLTVLLAKLARVRSNQNDRSAVLRSLREAHGVIDRISSLVSSLSADQYGGDSKKAITLVKNVILSTAGMLEAAYPDIEIEIAYPDRTGYAGIPPDLVEQLVMNLLLNASESMNGKGRINLTACRIELEKDFKIINAGDYVMICVSDRGCGIPEDTLLAVFDPFYSTKGKGRGLGLSAVYSIIHSYNGCIIINSVAGHGTIISVFIPVAEDITTETAEDIFPRVGIAGFSGKEEGLLLRILNSTGCQVVTIESPQEIGLCEPGDPDREYDIAIMDRSLIESGDAPPEKWLSPGLRAIVVWNRDEELPDTPDGRVRSIRRPLRIDCVSEAIASFVWRRNSKQPPFADEES